MFSRFRTRLLLLSGLALAGLGALTAVGLAVRSGQPDASAANPEQPPIYLSERLPKGTPVPLTADQCKQAANILGEMSKNRSDGETADALGPEGRADMDRVLSETSAWVGAGCPPDAVRGFYPDAQNPRSGELRVFSQQTFSPSGVLVLPAEK